MVDDTISEKNMPVRVMKGAGYRAPVSASLEYKTESERKVLDLLEC
jgi:hypothetical protein